MIKFRSAAMTLTACFLCFILFNTASVSGEEQSEARIAHGKYLVTIAGCNDCHSPKIYTAEGIPMPDTKRLLSGEPAEAVLPGFDPVMVAPGKWVLMNSHFSAFVGPWGVSYAANLTPDDQTGIGLWTEDIFVQALKTGKHMGAGRPILPPMPWPGLSNMTDEDFSAVFAYLKSLPPVKNKVPAPQSLEKMKQ